MDTEKKKKELEKQVQNLSAELETLAPNTAGKEKKEINLQNIVSIFLTKFPQIADHPDYHGEAQTYTDSAYIFFGVLNTILCDYYLGQQKEIELTKEIIYWMNDLYNSSKVDDEVRNMFAIEFFEKSDESDQYRNLLSEQLTDRAKKELEDHTVARNQQ